METIRLLLVEDNPVDALCLKEALEEARGPKFAICHVQTLAEAKERFEKEDFHAVVLDLGLPDSQGLTTFTQLQNFAPATPIVVLSGLDDETLARAAVREGAQDYLLKDKFDGYFLSRSIKYAIERKQAEKALRASQERFEMALRGADLGWWEWNVQTGEAIADERSTQLTGYSPDGIESYASLWESLVHPDDKAEVEKALDDHLKGSTALFESEHRLRIKSGDWKWILVRGKIIERDPKGEPLRVAGTYLDITDRKLAEQALRESEQRFRAVFEGSEDYIFVRDRSLRYTDANPAAGKLFNLPTAEILGRRYEDLFGEEGSKQYRDADLRVLAGQSVEEERTSKIHGIPRTFLDMKVPLKDDSGQIVGLLCTARDITERQRSEFPALKCDAACSSKAMRSTLSLANVAAHNDSTILLLGESGSGKRLPGQIHSQLL
jgi:PAS domain S-box-containing protein